MLTLRICASYFKLLKWQGWLIVLAPPVFLAARWNFLTVSARELLLWLWIATATSIVLGIFIQGVDTVVVDCLCAACGTRVTGVKSFISRTLTPNNLAATMQTTMQEELLAHNRSCTAQK